MIQAYKTSYAIDLDLKADKASATLDRINNSIKGLEKIIDKHLKGVNNLYTKQTKMLNKQIVLEKKKLGVLKEQAKVKNIKAKGTVSDKELALLKAQLKVQKDITIEKIKATKASHTEAARAALVTSKANNKINDRADKTKTKKDLIALKQEMIDTNTHATGLIHNMGRAVTTVPAFYAVYSAMNAVTTSFQATIEYAIQFDNTMRTLSAVTGETVNVTKELADGVFRLGSVYGGTLEDFATTAQELSRAGIDTKELVKATEVTAQLALITGDTIQSASNAVISYSQVYQKAGGRMVYTTEQLGDKLAYMANASRLSTQDIGTLSNYALASAKSVGLTIDQVNALAISFSNAGNNASTIGTQIRRFTNTLHSNSTAVKEFYKSISVNRTELLTNLGSSKDGTVEGIKKSNQAFEDFVRRVQSLSENEYKNAIYGMNVLDNQFFNQLRNNGEEAIGYMKTSFSDLNGELAKTGTIADGLGKRWERMWNRFKVGVDGSGLTESTTSFAEDVFNSTAALFDNYETGINLLLGEVSQADANAQFATLKVLKDLASKRQELINSLPDIKDKEESQAQSSLITQLTKTEAIEKQILDLRQEGKVVSDKLISASKEQQVILKASQAIYDVHKKAEEDRFIVADRIRLGMKKELQIQKDLAKGEATRIQAAKALELLEVNKLKLQSNKYQLGKYDVYKNNISSGISVPNKEKDLEIKALELQQSHLEKILLTNANILSLDKEHITELGLKNSTTEMYVEKLNNVKSLLDDQVRTFGSYAKAIGNTTGGLDSELVKNFIENTDALLKRQAQASLQYRNNLMQEELKVIDKLSAREIESIRHVDLAKGKSIGATINKLTEEGKFVEANAEAYAYKQKIQNEINKLKEEENGKDKISKDLIEAKIAKLEAQNVSLQDIVDTNSKGIQIQNMSAEAQSKITRNVEATNRQIIQSIKLAGQLEYSLLAAANALGVTMTENAILTGKMTQAQGNLEIKTKAVTQARLQENEALKIAKKYQDAYANSPTEKNRVESAKAIVTWERKKAETNKASNAIIKEENNQRVTTIRLATERKKLEIESNSIAKRNSKELRSKVAQAKVVVANRKLELAQAIKLSKIENRQDNSVLKARVALQRAEGALQDASIKKTIKAQKAGAKVTKELKKQNAELKRQQALLKESKLFNIGGSELVNLAKLGDELNRIGTEFGDTFSQLDLKEIYDAKTSKDTTEGFADMLQNAFGIGNDSVFADFFDKLESSFSGFVEAFSTGDAMDVSKATGSLIMSALPPGYKEAVMVLSALGSSYLSEEEIKAATGRSGDDFTSKGTEQIISTLEQFMQPQLNTSKSMLDHLKSMDSNLISALNASSGLDLGGSNYTPQTSSIAGGVIFASSTELLGAGIKFYDQAVAGFREGVEADGYEAVKKTSSWFGLFTSESVSESLKDLPSETKRQIGEAFNQGLQSSLDGLEILGFDTSAIEEQINKYVVSLGKINFKDLSIDEQSQALNRALTQELNNAVTEALSFTANPQLFADLESFKLGGEEITATIARVAIGFETVGTSLNSLGLTVDTFNQSQALVDAMGGLQSFSSVMQTFTQNFFSPEEQKEINRITLETALLRHNVVLPATKAEFKNLFIATQQKLLAVQADIDLRKAEIRSQIESGTFKQKIAVENAKIDKFMIDGMALSGQAAVVAGKNFFAMYENLQGAAKEAIVFDAETGEISIDFDALNDSTLNALEATKSELSGLLGTLSSNMGGFVDYYSESAETSIADATSSIGESTSTITDAVKALAYPATEASNALLDLSKTLTTIAGIQDSWSGDLGLDAKVRSTRLNRESVGERVHLADLNYADYLTQFDALLNRDKEMHPETLKAWQQYGDALRAEHDAVKARDTHIRNLASGIADLQGTWSGEESILKAQRALDNVQALNGLPELNFNNFQSAFDEAVVNGLDSDGLKEWDTLSNALRTLNDATSKATKGLDDFKSYANKATLKAFDALGTTTKATFGSLQMAIKRGNYDDAKTYYSKFLEDTRNESLTRKDYTNSVIKANSEIQRLDAPKNPYKRMEDNQERLINEIKLLRADNEKLMGEVAFNTNKTVKNTDRPSIQKAG